MVNIIPLKMKELSAAERTGSAGIFSKEGTHSDFMLYKGQVLVSTGHQPYSVHVLRVGRPLGRSGAKSSRGPGFLASLALLRGDQLGGELRGRVVLGISTLHCLFLALK